jgi:uncharacterized protein YjbJ (UPF0337 family)
MDSNRVKGTVDEVVGSARQKTGELTDNSTLQIKGAVQQAKGKLENALGKAKDGIQDAKQRASAGSKHVV